MSFLKNMNIKFELLRANWIRPEDVKYYNNICSLIKLSTRHHNNIKMILDSYINEKYIGNILDILDSKVTGLVDNIAILNEKIPDDFFKYVSTCNRQCHICNYCMEI
jgi:hypothetical protein